MIMKETVNAVNSHKAVWPAGYIMSVEQNGKEVTYSEFKQCVREMSENK
jgi:hypothetical protein